MFSNYYILSITKKINKNISFFFSQEKKRNFIHLARSKLHSVDSQREYHMHNQKSVMRL